MVRRLFERLCVFVCVCIRVCVIVRKPKRQRVRGNSCEKPIVIQCPVRNCELRALRLQTRPPAFSYRCVPIRRNRRECSTFCAMCQERANVRARTDNYVVAVSCLLACVCAFMCVCLLVKRSNAPTADWLRWLRWRRQRRQRIDIDGNHDERQTMRAYLRVHGSNLLIGNNHTCLIRVVRTSRDSYIFHNGTWTFSIDWIVIDFDMHTDERRGKNTNDFSNDFIFILQTPDVDLYHIMSAVCNDRTTRSEVHIAWGRSTVTGTDYWIVFLFANGLWEVEPWVITFTY